MVYVDPIQLKWMPYVKSWVVTLPEATVKAEYQTQIIDLFETYFDAGLVFCRRNCIYPIAQVKMRLLIIQKLKLNFFNIFTRSILAKQL